MVERVGADDSFFDLGGDPLSATRVIAAVNETFALHFPVRTLFAAPSVKGIFDGVICAFHCHTDTMDLQDVVTRLAALLPADPAEIEEHCSIAAGQCSATSPGLPRSTRRGSSGTRQITCASRASYPPLNPTGPRWVIMGELVELSR
ncbi:MAG: acyl carrier protein [Mycobacterium sp.]